MIAIIRCTGLGADFRALVTELDKELNERYGEQMEFFDQFNHSIDVQNAVVAYLDGVPAGCGCFKQFSGDTVEMKRMFVKKSFRGKRIARAVIGELEAWAKELGYTFVVLETGILQPEAIRLYEAAGYHRIPNYPPYVGVEESISYQKEL